MTDDIERLFMGLFAINIYILVKYLFKSFAHFYWIICFLIIQLCTLFIYILDTSLLSDINFANIFSQCVACIFIFLTVPLEEKFLIFD